MSLDPETLAVMNLLHHARRGAIESTKAETVNVSADVYNVTGSTEDPIPGDASSWKQLLIDNGIPSSAKCYVTNTSGGSHNDFSVGGHMTTDASGVVAKGGTCYLMPLCFWHNSTARDGCEFEHTETLMLELSGFLKGDSATTFLLRLPAPEPYAVLTLAGGRWQQHQLRAHQLYGGLHGLREAPIEYQVVFRRHPQTHALHYLDEARHR